MIQIDIVLACAIAVWVVSIVFHIPSPFKQVLIAKEGDPTGLAWPFVAHGIAGALRPIAVLAFLHAMLKGWPTWSFWLLIAGVFDLVQGAVSFFTYIVRKP